MEFGLAPERVLEVLGFELDPPAEDENGSAASVPMSHEAKSALGDASSRAKAFDRSQSVGTEHILAGLLAIESDGAVAERLELAGLAVAALLESLEEAQFEASAPIPMAAEITPLELVEPSQAVDLARILDASANRAREGLRVVKDYIRFALDDPLLTRRIKEVRHRLAETLKGFDPEMLLGSRDTRGDVGTHIMTTSEQARENPRAVLIANFKRTAEASGRWKNTASSSTSGSRAGSRFSGTTSTRSRS